jgi:hypothetical protein
MARNAEVVVKAETAQARAALRRARRSCLLALRAARRAIGVGG